MKEKLILRQGDVCLIATKNKNGIKQDKKVVAYGEQSNHHHILVGDAELVESKGKMYVVTGKGKAYIAHLKESDMTMADHHPIELDTETTYEVRLQNNYNPYLKLMERVKD